MHVRVPCVPCVPREARTVQVPGSTVTGIGLSPTTPPLTSRTLMVSLEDIFCRVERNSPLRGVTAGSSDRPSLDSMAWRGAGRERRGQRRSSQVGIILGIPTAREVRW